MKNIFITSAGVPCLYGFEQMENNKKKLLKSSFFNRLQIFAGSRSKKK